MIHINRWFEVGPCVILGDFGFFGRSRKHCLGSMCLFRGVNLYWNILMSNPDITQKESGRLDMSIESYECLAVPLYPRKLKHTWSSSSGRAVQQETENDFSVSRKVSKRSNLKGYLKHSKLGLYGIIT